MTRDDYDRRLAAIKERHPWLFAGEHIGIDVESGWLAIFEELCDHLAATVPEERRTGVWFEQVKEKMGGLRAYLSISSTRIDLINTGDSYEAPSDDDLYDRLRPLVHAAEAKSRETCQLCGATPASSIRDAGLVMTLCQAHQQLGRLGYDGRKADFAAFTTAGHTPAPPSAAEAAERLIAARQELLDLGVQDIAVTGPDRYGYFLALCWFVADAGDDLSHRSSASALVPRLLRWPTRVVSLAQPSWQERWQQADGGEVRWLLGSVPEL